MNKSISMDEAGRNDGVLLEGVPEPHIMTRYIHVDSRDRLLTSSGTENYEIALPEPLFGVQSVTLVSAEMPKSEYFLDESNNTLVTLIDPTLNETQGATPNDQPSSAAIMQLADASGTQLLAIPALHGFESSRVVLHFLQKTPDALVSVRKLIASSVHVINGSFSTHFASTILPAATADARTIITAYSETDTGNIASIRVVTVTLSGATVLQVRNGREQPSEGLGTRLVSNTLTRLPVFHKALAAVDTTRFGIAYYQNFASLRFRLCAVGAGADTDTTFTNAQPFSSLTNTHVVQAWRAAGISSSDTNLLGGSLVVYSAGFELRAVLMQINRLSFVLSLSSPDMPSALIASSDSSFRRNSFDVAAFGRHFAIAYVLSTQQVRVKFGYTTGSALTFTREFVSTALAFPLVALSWQSPGEQSFFLSKSTAAGNKLHINSVADVLLNLRAGGTYTFRCEMPLYLSGAPNNVAEMLATTIIDPPDTARRVFLAENNGTQFVTLHIPRSYNSTIFYFGIDNGTTTFDGGQIAVDNLAAPVSNTLLLTYSGAHDVGLMPYAWGTADTNADVRPNVSTYRSPHIMKTRAYVPYQQAHAAATRVTPLMTMPYGPRPASTFPAFAATTDGIYGGIRPAVILTDSSTWLYYEETHRWQHAGPAPPQYDGALLSFNDYSSSGLVMQFGGYGVPFQGFATETHAARMVQSSTGAIEISRIRSETDFAYYQLHIDGSLSTSFNSTYASGWTGTGVILEADGKTRVPQGSICTHAPVNLSSGAAGDKYTWSVCVRSNDNTASPVHVVRLATTVSGVPFTVDYSLEPQKWQLLQVQLDLSAVAGTNTDVTFSVQNNVITDNKPLTFFRSQVVRETIVQTVSPGAHSCEVRFVATSTDVVDSVTASLDALAAPTAAAFNDEFWWLTFDASFGNTLFMTRVDNAQLRNACEAFSHAQLLNITSVNVQQSTAQSENSSHQLVTHAVDDATFAAGYAKIYNAGGFTIADALEFAGRSALKVTGLTTGVLNTLELEYFSMSCWFRCSAPQASLAVDFALVGGSLGVNAVDGAAPVVDNSDLHVLSNPDTASARPFSGTTLPSYLRLRPNVKLTYASLQLLATDFAVAFFVRLTQLQPTGEAFELVTFKGISVRVSSAGLLRVSDSTGATLLPSGTATLSIADGNWHHVYISVSASGILNFYLDTDFTAASVAATDSASVSVTATALDLTIGQLPSSPVSLTGGVYDVSWLYVFDGATVSTAAGWHSGGGLYQPVATMMSMRQTDTTPQYIELAVHLRTFDASGNALPPQLVGTVMNTSVACTIQLETWHFASLVQEPTIETTMVDLYLNGASAVTPVANPGVEAMQFANDLTVGARRLSQSGDLCYAFVGRIDEASFAMGNILRTCHSYIGAKTPSNAVRTWAWMQQSIRYVSSSTTTTLTPRAYGGRGMHDDYGRMYVFGGETATSFANDLWVFLGDATSESGTGQAYENQAPGRWLLLDSAATNPTGLRPSPRKNFACGITRNTHDLIIFGGVESATTPVSQTSILWVFDIDNGQWMLNATGSNSLHAVTNAPILGQICSWMIDETLHFIGGTQFSLVSGSYFESIANDLVLYTYTHSVTTIDVDFAAIAGQKTPQASFGQTTSLPSITHAQRTHYIRYTATASPGVLVAEQSNMLTSRPAFWAKGPQIYILPTGKKDNATGTVSALWVNQTSGYSAESNLGFGVVMPLTYSLPSFPGSVTATVAEAASGRITFKDSAIGVAADNSESVLRTFSLHEHGARLAILHSTGGAVLRVLALDSALTFDGLGTMSNEIQIVAARGPALAVEQRLTTAGDTLLRLAYQDVFVNRAGRTRVVRFSNSTLELSLDTVDGSTTVDVTTFSTANPTRNISVLAAGNGSSIVAYFGDEAGAAGIYLRTVQITAQAHSVSAPVSSTTAAASRSSIALVPIASLEADDTGAPMPTWLMGFIYEKVPAVDEKGRIVLQRIVENSIVQDVVGENIFVTSDYNVATLEDDRQLRLLGSIQMHSVDVAATEEMAVAAWVTGVSDAQGNQVNRLRFQDIALATSTGTPLLPAQASSTNISLAARTIDFQKLAEIAVVLISVAQPAVFGVDTLVLSATSGINVGDSITHADSLAIPIETLVRQSVVDVASQTTTVTLGKTMVDVTAAAPQGATQIQLSVTAADVITLGDQISHVDGNAIPPDTKVMQVSMATGVATVQLGAADTSGNVTTSVALAASLNVGDRVMFRDQAGAPIYFQSVLKGTVPAGSQVQLRESYDTSLISNTFPPGTLDLANSFSANSNVLSTAVVDSALPGFPSMRRACALVRTALLSISNTAAATDVCTVVVYVDRGTVGTAVEHLRLRLLRLDLGLQEVSVPCTLFSAATVQLMDARILFDGTLQALLYVTANVSTAADESSITTISVDMRACRHLFLPDVGHTAQLKLDPAGMNGAVPNPVSLNGKYVVNNQLQDEGFTDINALTLGPTADTPRVNLTDSTGTEIAHTLAITRVPGTPPTVRITFDAWTRGDIQITTATTTTSIEVSAAVTVLQTPSNAPVTGAGTLTRFNNMRLRELASFTDNQSVLHVPFFSNALNSETAFLMRRNIQAGQLTTVPISVLMTPGDYTQLADLATEIQTQLQKVDSNFTCDAVASTHKLRIRNAFSAFELLMNLQTLLAFGISNDVRNATNGFAYIIGFRSFSNQLSSITPDGTGSNLHEIVSDKRVDTAGRSYLYLHLTANPEGHPENAQSHSGGISISAETTSATASFARIPLACDKGEIMYFMEDFDITATVDIPRLNSLHVKLCRYHIMENKDKEERNQTFFYQPQGVEHSFSLRVKCHRDAHGSAAPMQAISAIPQFEVYRPLITADDQAATPQHRPPIAADEQASDYSDYSSDSMP